MYPLARLLRPLNGATANARDAVHLDTAERERRRDNALQQARALGPAAWTVLDAGAAGPGHALDLYADDAALLTRLSAYVADGLASGETSLVIATTGHLSGLRARLRLAGLEVPTGAGRLVTLDAEEVLRCFLRDEWPDPELFDLAVAEPMRAAGAPLRAFSETVGLLHARGLAAAAHQLEKLWGALQLSLGFPLVCAYPLSGNPEADAELAERVCGWHSHRVSVSC
ncbi:MAG: MEDS domain-containing protein [Frankiales bacterium]|nr:MEDS domain-containing protein [Frankiales bacterium]